VGVVFLVAGLLKSADMALFVQQIKAYGIVSQWSILVAIAWAMVVLEMALGVGLIVAYRVKIVFPATALLLLAFLGITVWAWFTGSTEACGCFGAWIERTPGEAALEDVVLLTLLGLAWVGFRKRDVSQGRWKTGAVVASCLMGLALPAAFGFSFSGIQESASKTDETALGQFAVQGLGDFNLNSGTYLILVMDTGCDHCQEVVPEVNLLSEMPEVPPIIGLCVNGESDRMAFAEAFQPVFPMGQIEDDVFWRLLGDGDMPRTMLIHDGYVKKIWDLNPPPPDAVTTVPLS
jgi:hypothetical protein